MLKMQCSRAMVQGLPWWSSGYNSTSNAGSTDSNPDQEIKVPHAVDRAAKNQKKKKRKKETRVGKLEALLIKEIGNHRNLVRSPDAISTI